MPNSFLGEVGGSLIGLGTAYLQNQWAMKAQEEAFKRQRQLLELQLMQQQLAFSGRMGGQVVVGPGGLTMEGGGSMSLGEPPCNPMVDPMCAGPVWTPGPMLTGGGGGCCPRGAITVTPADAPGLYRQGCSPCSPVQTRARFFALRADGTRDLFVRVGKVQSVSPRTLTRFARRWAKEAKLTVSARGGPRARGGRRGPR